MARSARSVKGLLYILYFLALSASSVYLRSPHHHTQDASAEYELIWSDEFDQPFCPFPEHWNHERGFVRNHELEWFQPENAYCRDEMLIIEARRENKPNPTYVPGTRNWQQRRKNIEYT